MEALERWAKVGFPEEAGRLILDHAGHSFPPINQYPETANDQLLRLLWNGKTTVAGEDVEATFPGLDEACRASAIRLLAEVGTPSASESLARILVLCVKDRLPSVGWPFLLPLERTPRDPGVLIPSMLALLEKTEGAGPVHERYVVAESLRSIASIRSRLAALKDALGTLPVNALERTDTIEDFKREYGKTRSLVAVNRTLGILRHAMKWGRGRTPAIFMASPFHRFGVKIKTRGETNGIAGLRWTKSDGCWKRPTSSIAPSTRSPAPRCVIELSALWRPAADLARC